MVVWGKNEDGQGNNAPQWGIGGDTFVVGCELPNGMVFPEFNKLAIRLANKVGMEFIGIQRKSFMKRGTLYDQHFFSLNKEDVCQQ